MNITTLFVSLDSSIQYILHRMNLFMITKLQFQSSRLWFDLRWDMIYIGLHQFIESVCVSVHYWVQWKQGFLHLKIPTIQMVLITLLCHLHELLNKCRCYSLKEFFELEKFEIALLIALACNNISSVWIGECAIRKPGTFQFD